MDHGCMRRLDLQEQFPLRLPQGDVFLFANLVTVAGEFTVSQRAMPEALDIIRQPGDGLNQHVAVAKQHGKVLDCEEEKGARIIHLQE